MPSPYSRLELQTIKKALSSARMSTYEAVIDRAGNKLNDEQALGLYAWNAQVSAAFLAPLHICEIVVRNAVAEVLESQYGSKWPWSAGFEQSLPDPKIGYSPRADLRSARRAAPTTGKVIPELAFVFWQKMFTGRYDVRLWNAYLVKTFPNLPHGQSVSKSRQAIYDDLEHIRKLRNRIAHHEPIFSRPLTDDFKRIMDLVTFRCPVTAGWMNESQQATQFIQQRPV